MIWPGAPFDFHMRENNQALKLERMMWLTLLKEVQIVLWCIRRGCIGYCDFKGVLVRGEVTDRFNLVVIGTHRAPRLLSAFLSSQHLRRIAVRVSRCILHPERWEVEPPLFPFFCLMPIIIYNRYSNLISSTTMFFPVTEAETRQKLLRSVKKEVCCVLFLCRSSQFLFTGAVVRAPFVGLTIRPAHRKNWPLVIIRWDAIRLSIKM